MPEAKKAAAPVRKAAAKKTATKAAGATPAGRAAVAAEPAVRQVAERRAAAREQRAGERHQAFRRREAERVQRRNTVQGRSTLEVRQARAKRLNKGLSWAWSGNRRLLTAQYLLCVVVLGLGWIVAPAAGTSGQGSKASSETTTRAMIKFSALSGLFFLLAVLSAGGKGAAKGATALGTLVAATYLFTSSDAHAVVSWINSFFSSGDIQIGAGESGSVFTPGESNDVGTPSSAFGPQS